MNVDISRTRAYYDSVTEDSLCDCAYCRNYRLQVRNAYPEVTAWLGDLGISVEKPMETSPLEPDAEGMLEYCACQYIAFGNCGPEFRYRVGDVQFRRAASYPPTGIEQEHFVLEMYPVRLKYVP